MRWWPETTDEWIERMAENAPLDPYEQTIYWADLSVQTAEKAERRANIATVLLSISALLWLIVLLLMIFT